MTDYIKRTWAEIDLDAIEYNYRLFKDRNKTAVLGIVKADAYGLGAIEVSKKLEKSGARYLAVACLSEGVQLREAGIKTPILVLGFTPEEYTDILVKNNITQGIGSLEAAENYSKAASKCGGTLTAHLKLDTGMGRLGFLTDEEDREESLKEIAKVLALPNIKWEGVFTHFAVSDEPAEECVAFTRLQYKRFTETIAEIEKAWGRKFELKHCNNSGGSTNYPEYALDMVRPGVSLYGSESFNKDVKLKQAFKLKTMLGPIRNVPANYTISYGRTYTTDKPRRIGVLPIGYADGLNRGLSGKLSVMTPDGPAPVVGRICMDMCMVDLTDLPNVKTGAEIEVIGDYNTVPIIAKKLGTITQFVTCPIAPRVPRIYFEDGKEVARRVLL